MTSPEPEESTTARIDESDRQPGLLLTAVWNGGSLVYPLPPKGTLGLGRSAPSVLRIDHGSVSRRHAMLVISEAGMRIDDLGSANGTFVNGRRLDPNTSAPIRAGSLIELGQVLVVVQDTRMPDERPLAQGVVVADPAMAKIHETLGMVAKSALSVILLGETGTGKEVLASRVHALSRRADGPFLKVNCAALVESILEAELFGYERGAFTGATQAKAGLLEGAHGGTLFLDEVGETPLATQAKLLRVLESGEVMRVGALKARPIDVRFVAATNRNLRECVTRGSFRQDLFFRLDGISLSIPPLRERPSEIAALAERFVQNAAEAAGRAPVVLAGDALAALQAYPWPGNVRELRNVITRSVLLCSTTVLEAADLRFEGYGHEPSAAPAMSPAARAPAPSPVPSFGSGLRPSSIPHQSTPTDVPRVAGRPPLSPAAEEERRRVQQALDRSAGNQTRAAKLLGISRRTLLKRLDALAFPRPRKRDASEVEPDGGAEGDD